jgi:hypothetical protein
VAKSVYGYPFSQFFFVFLFSRLGKMPPMISYPIYEWKEVFFSFGENSLPKAPGAGKVTIK